MNPVIITEEERTKIRGLVERAFANPISLATLKAWVGVCDINDHTTRDADLERDMDAMSIVIPAGYKVVFTVEEQPTGLCRHLSMSSPSEGRAPIPAALEMVMSEFGFETPLSQCQVYPEEFGPNHVAINVIEQIKEAA